MTHALTKPLKRLIALSPVVQKHTTAQNSKERSSSALWGGAHPHPAAGQRGALCEDGAGGVQAPSRPSRHGEPPRAEQLPPPRPRGSARRYTPRCGIVGCTRLLSFPKLGFDLGEELTAKTPQKPRFRSGGEHCVSHSGSSHCLGKRPLLNSPVSEDDGDRSRHQVTVSSAH